MMHRQGSRQGSGGPPSGFGPEDALQPGAPSLAVADSLEFKVSYTLGEYVAFMWQHSARLIRRRRITGLAGWWMTFKTTWHAALNFIMLRRSRQLYEFTIDPQEELIMLVLTNVQPYSYYNDFVRKFRTGVYQALE